MQVGNQTYNTMFNLTFLYLPNLVEEYKAVDTASTWSFQWESQSYPSTVSVAFDLYEVCIGVMDKGQQSYDRS